MFVSWQDFGFYIVNRLFRWGPKRLQTVCEWKSELRGKFDPLFDSLNQQGKNKILDIFIQKTS